MYEIKYHKNTVKDIPKLKAAKLDTKAKDLIEIIKEDPFRYPPKWEELQGDMRGYYSRRINLKHRLVYKVTEETRIIRVLSMWTHYD